MTFEGPKLTIRIDQAVRWKEAIETCQAGLKEGRQREIKAGNY